MILLLFQNDSCGVSPIQLLQQQLQGSSNGSSLGGLLLHNSHQNAAGKFIFYVLDFSNLAVTPLTILSYKECRLNFGPFDHSLLNFHTFFPSFFFIKICNVNQKIAGLRWTFAEFAFLYQQPSFFRWTYKFRTEK